MLTRDSRETSTALRAICDCAFTVGFAVAYAFAVDTLMVVGLARLAFGN